jgi:prepilin-type N-terminal cleavage/methylation domain-containing protein
MKKLKIKKIKSKIKILFLQQKGYTLAELLTVVMILVIIATAVVGIISSTLRGTSKTKVTTDVSQNGQYASSLISSIIEDSRNVLQINGNDLDDCTNSPSSSLLTPTPGVNSPSVTLKRTDGGKTVLSCQTIGNVATIASNGASLIDTNVVKVQNCTFSCSQLVSDPYSVPVVNISFDMLSAKGTNNENTAQTTNYNFQTSLRVYSP